VESDLNDPFGKAQAREEFSWMALLQLILSLLAFFVLLSSGLIFALVGIGQLTSRAPGISDTTSTFLYAGGLAFSGCLLLPSAGYALRRLVKGTSLQPSRYFGGGWLLLASGLLVFLMPLILFAGNQVAGQENISWIILPPLHVLVVVIPIFWLVVMGLRGLPRGSGQRSWGLLGAGLSLAPALILFLELALLAVFIVVALFFISRQPGLSSELTNLVERLRTTSNPEVLVQFFLPYLQSPEVVVGLFAYIAIFVPLIEEALKPVGIWFLAGRRLSPVEGFTAGLLSGAGYALFENIFLSTTGAQWMILVLARVGTGAVHIFTASLVGWGLASAWSQGRYLRLGLTFAAAVCVHALWNGLTLLTTGLQFAPNTTLITSTQVLNLFAIGLGLLAFLCILMIWLMNRSLKRAIIAPLSKTALSQTELPEAEQLSDRETDEV